MRVRGKRQQIPGGTKPALRPKLTVLGDPRWNGLRAQKKKKEEWASGITTEKKPISRDDIPRPPGL